MTGLTPGVLFRCGHSVCPGRSVAEAGLAEWGARARKRGIQAVLCQLQRQALDHSPNAGNPGNLIVTNMARTKTEKTVALEGAILATLREAKEPMHYADVAEQISAKARFANFGPKPASEVYTLISNNLNTKGSESPFLKVGRGTFGLRSTSAVAGFGANASEIAAAPQVEEEAREGHEIVTAFGIYWRRDLVKWQTVPRLYGRQQQGAETVDFGGERGVYLLYDGREAIYAGRTTDQPLGQRLNQHTFDRMGGRWDRFSWFGILPLTEEGKLQAEPNLSKISAGDLITTMEALLIEGLEPRQNRKKGDGFTAVEYLQSEDPMLETERKRRTIEEMVRSLQPKLL